MVGRPHALHEHSRGPLALTEAGTGVGVAALGPDLGDELGGPGDPAGRVDTHVSGRPLVLGRLGPEQFVERGHAMSLGRRNRRGIVPVLTWSGLRGGISVAMVLSLPRFPARDYLLACTYAVVVFSILAQGLTVRRVLVHYGVGEPGGG